jgi:hypothetical protein
MSAGSPGRVVGSVERLNVGSIAANTFSHGGEELFLQAVSCWLMKKNNQRHESDNMFNLNSQTFKNGFTKQLREQWLPQADVTSDFYS